MKLKDLEAIMKDNPGFAAEFKKLSPEEQEKFSKGVVEKKKKEPKKETGKATGPRIIPNDDNGL